MKITHDMPNTSDETEHGMYNKWKWKSAIWLRFTQRSGNFLIPKFWLRKILCDLKRQSHQFLTASVLNVISESQNIQVFIYKLIISNGRSIIQVYYYYVDSSFSPLLNWSRDRITTSGLFAQWCQT